MSSSRSKSSRSKSSWWRGVRVFHEKTCRPRRLPLIRPRTLLSKSSSRRSLTPNSPPVEGWQAKPDGVVSHEYRQDPPRQKKPPPAYGVPLRRRGMFSAGGVERYGQYPKHGVKCKYKSKSKGKGKKITALKGKKAKSQKVKASWQGGSLGCCTCSSGCCARDRPPARPAGRRSSSRPEPPGPSRMKGL